MQEPARSIEPVGMTRAEFTARWKISDATFFRWLKTGKIRGIRVAGTLRIPFEEDERLRKNGEA